jgi:glycosyltransferase involved in cell wall biosynthesis
VASTLHGADAVIVNSELTRRGVEAIAGQRDHLYVVHPGADVTGPVRASRSHPTLVTLANLEPHKSQADVIRAVAALAGRHPELRYVLVGRGPQRQELQALAERLGVGERVEFKGALPHALALEEVARCHLHVMPSRYDGFGVAHIDAMGAGLPTIAGMGTGAQDIADAGEGILMIRPGDVTALVDVIDDLLTDERKRRRLGELATNTIFEHFSWQRNGERTATIYRRFTGGSENGVGGLSVRGS